MQAIKTMLKALRVLLGRKADKEWVEDTYLKKTDTPNVTVPVPDWDINDPDEGGYIKNRIAYTEYEEVGKFRFDSSGNILEADKSSFRALVISPFDAEAHENKNALRMSVVFPNGDEYIVQCAYHYNGQAHEMNLTDTGVNSQYRLRFYCDNISIDTYFSASIQTKGVTIPLPTTATFRTFKVKQLDEKYSTNGNIKNGNSVGSVMSIQSYDKLNPYEMGEGAFSVGHNSKASGKYSFAHNGTASGEGSFAIGGTASGENSCALGGTASGFSSVSESGVASGNTSHSERTGTASGDYSHAGGRYVEASGKYAVATGVGYDKDNQTVASGECSRAHGYLVKASGKYAVAEGTGYRDRASYSSPYVCNYTEASGDYSHAEGWCTKAIGNGSHAEGNYTKATSSYSHAAGSYNRDDGYIYADCGELSDEVFTTSDGTAVANFTKDGLYYSGTGFAYGKIKFKFTSTTNVIIRGLAADLKGTNSACRVSTLDTDLAVSASYDSTMDSGSHYIYQFSKYINGKTQASGTYHEFALSVPSGEHYITFKCYGGGTYKIRTLTKNYNNYLNRYLETVGNGSSPKQMEFSPEYEDTSNARSLDVGGNGYYSGNVYANVERGLKENAAESNKLTTKSELDEAVNSKLDAPATAAAGQVIAVKTVDEDGNITEVEAVDMTGGSGGTPNAVQYVEQTLTEEQKAQARANIGASSSQDLTTLGTAVESKLPTPASAAVGQIVKVKAVDENGKVTEVETVETVEVELTEIDEPTETPESSIFEGKTASFYGDSLTEVNNHYTKGYHQWIKELLGLASYNNYGVSGYKISDVYNKIASVNDSADIIFVMCGVNDENFSTPLGVFGDATTDTIYGAYDVLCSTLKEKYPTKLIVFITPHYQTKYPHSSGITSYDISKAMKAVCEKYSLPVYDNFVLSGIYTTNLSYWTTDNCHWNNKAHEMTGKNISQYMIDTFRYLCMSLSSISVSYSGGGVAVGAALSSLQDIVVTATYSDGSTENVTGYTLSGTIEEGANTITVTYQGKTATFSVTGFRGLQTGENVTATIKKAEVNSTTHIAFVFKNTLKESAVVYKVTADLDTSEHAYSGKTNAPWAYASLENFVKGTSTSCGSNATATSTDNHVEVISKSYKVTTDYAAMLIPISGSSYPFTVEISNIHVYQNDMEVPIIAIGTWKNNTNGEYADIEITDGTTE